MHRDLDLSGDAEQIEVSEKQERRPNGESHPRKDRDGAQQLHAQQLAAATMDDTALVAALFPLVSAYMHDLLPIQVAHALQAASYAAASRTGAHGVMLYARWMLSGRANRPTATTPQMPGER